MLCVCVWCCVCVCVCAAPWIGFLFACLWNKATAEFQLLLDILLISHRAILLTVHVWQFIHTVVVQCLHTAFCGASVLGELLVSILIVIFLFRAFQQLQSRRCSNVKIILQTSSCNSNQFWIQSILLTIGSFYYIWRNVTMLKIIFGLYVRMWWCNRRSQQIGSGAKLLLDILAWKWTHMQSLLCRFTWVPLGQPLQFCTKTIDWTNMQFYLFKVAMLARATHKTVKMGFDLRNSWRLIQYARAPSSPECDHQQQWDMRDVQRVLARKNNTVTSSLPLPKYSETSFKVAES